MSPSTGPRLGTPLTNEDLGGKPAVLYLADSSLARTLVTSSFRTFQYRYDKDLAEEWENDGQTPLSHRVYRDNDYMMIDRSELLPGDPDRHVFVTTGSGMCIRWGGTRAQSPTASDLKHLVYEVFNLASDFAFDAIFVYMGTNDLKNIISRRVGVKHVLPKTMGDFVEEVEGFLLEVSRTFRSRVCYLGSGPGELPPSAIPENPESTELIPRKMSGKQATYELRSLLSLLNATICGRAGLTYDEDGFIRQETRVVLFGQSAVLYPPGMTDPGTGHFQPGSISYLAVMLHNIAELVLAKMRVIAGPPSRPLRLIKIVKDARRYTDSRGNARPIEYCVPWEPEALKQFTSTIMLKSTTNGAKPELALDVRFSLPKHLQAKVTSEPGKFRLGQVGAIKLSAEFENHHPEDHGVVIDGEDHYYCLMYNINAGHVALVPHGQVVVPYYWSPADHYAADLIKEDLLTDVQEWLEKIRASASNNKSGFPPLQQPDNPENGVLGIPGIDNTNRESHSGAHAGASDDDL
jgi:hypothetical protein